MDLRIYRAGVYGNTNDADSVSTLSVIGRIEFIDPK
jgi:hypothetical protein